MSQAQKTAILNLSKRRGIDEAELNTMVEEAYGVTFDQLIFEGRSTVHKKPPTGCLIHINNPS